MTISSLDLEVRLQLLGQSSVYESKLTLLGIYIELLSGYQVDECGYSQVGNCLTEDQANLLFDKITKLTGLCFQPLGFNYKGTTSSQGGISKMQIGCNFIVS